MIESNKNKLPKARLGKLTIEELSIVDRPCQEPATVALMKRAADGPPAEKIAKHNLATTEVDGHAHAIRIYDDGSMWVESATMTGAEYSHSHGLVRGADGSLQILPDSGHAHDLAADQPSLVLVDPNAIVVVQARATATLANVAGSLSANKSTQAPAAKETGTTTEKFQMPTEQEKQIADLTKRNERLDRIAKMSGAHKAHFDTLIGEDADAFLAKSTADREAVVQKALEDDKPIWTGEVTKVAVRKRDGELALQLAKQNEHNAVLLAKQAADIEKAEVRKRAAETLGKLAGADAVHDLIVRSVLKSGAKQEEIDAALTAMKGWNELAATKAKAPGFGGSDPAPADGEGELRKAVEEFAKANNIPRYELAYVKAIESDPKVRRLYEESRS